MCLLTHSFHNHIKSQIKRKNCCILHNKLSCALLQLIIMSFMCFSSLIIGKIASYWIRLCMGDSKNAYACEYDVHICVRVFTVHAGIYVVGLFTTVSTASLRFFLYKCRHFIIFNAGLYNKFLLLLHVETSVRSYRRTRV